MKHSISRIIKQIGTVNAAADRIELRLSDRSHFFLPKKHPKYNLWTKLLSRPAHEDPLYIGGDPKTHEVETILPPLARTIREFRELPSRHIATVNFLESPATFTLSFDHPNYSSLKSLFNRAQRSGKYLWIAANPLTLEILHAVEASLPATTERGIFTTRCSDEVVTYGEAAREFDRLKNSSSIPFKYLPDCCNARAHEMCKLLVLAGFKPCKVWNYGQGFAHFGMPTIQVQTPLLPQGFVKWSYHVAPMLQCKHFADYVVPVVLDPALFDRPVLLDQWVNAQQDPKSEVEVSGPKPFHRELRGKKLFFDPSFVTTERALAAHRYSLELAASA